MNPAELDALLEVVNRSTVVVDGGTLRFALL